MTAGDSVTQHASEARRAEAVRYASFGRRFVALLIDGTVLSAVFFATTRVVTGVWLMQPADHRWHASWFITDPLCMIFLLILALYFIALEGLFGQTIGKRCLGMRVVTVTGASPGWRKSIIRNLLRVVDGLPALGIVGTVLIVTSRDRTRFGDRAARTWVIRA